MRPRHHTSIMCGPIVLLAACHVTVVQPPSKPVGSEPEVETAAPAPPPAPEATAPPPASPAEPTASTTPLDSPTATEKVPAPATSQPPPAKSSAKAKTSKPDAEKTTAAPTPTEPSPAEPDRSPAPAADAPTITVKKVVVLREGTDLLIGADVFRVGEAVPFTSTPAGGVATPNRTCERNRDQFDAKALIGDFFDVVPKLPCAEELRFELAFSEDVAHAMRLGDEAMSAGRPGEAFSFYSAAAERLARKDAGAAKLANKKAARALAQALGIDGLVQIKSGKPVLQPKAVTKLKALQAQSGLPTTGALDGATRKALGGIDEAEAMRRAAAADTAAPEQLEQLRKAPQRSPLQR